MSDIIWESAVDGYNCVVERVNTNTGHFTVTDGANKVILDQQVSLTVGNQGVSLTDITAWYTLAKTAIQAQ